MAGKRIFVFDSPRTRSQLFNRIFSAHPQLHQVFHPFFTAGAHGPERHTARFQQCREADEVQQAMVLAPGMDIQTFEKAFDDLQKEVESIEHDHGRTVWIKEHVVNCVQPAVLEEVTKHGIATSTCSNTTILPDDFLASLTPVILIRHPALMIASWYRAQTLTLRQEAGDKAFKFFSTLLWARIVFDLLRTRRGAAPLVLDSEYLVAQPQAYTKKICDELDLAHEGICFEWHPVPAEEQESMDFMRRHFFGELMSSDRIQSSKAKIKVDVDVEQERWTSEFGAGVASRLRQLVDENLEHYLYLSSFRLTL